MLFSCQDSTDRYTQKRPYISKNAVGPGAANESCIESLISYYNRWRGNRYDLGYYMPLSEKLQYISEHRDSGIVVIIGRKKSSRSYYWTQSYNDNVSDYGYTDSVIEIKEILAHNSSEFENWKAGDTVNIIEAFAMSPDNQYTFDNYDGNSPYINYKDGEKISKGFKTTTASVISSEYDNLIILVRKAENVSSVYVDGAQLDKEKFSDRYVSYFSYLLTPNAAKSEYYPERIFEGFDFKNETTGLNSYAIHCMGTYEAWETYGNRVTE